MFLAPIALQPGSTFTLFCDVPLFIAENKTACERVAIFQINASTVNSKFWFQASFRLGHTVNIFVFLLLLLRTFE